MDRGQFIGGGLATIYLQELWQPALVAIERRVGGRLDVSAIEIADNGTGGRIVEHRANERFPLCSTFKMLLVSAVLAKVDAGHERLDRRIAYGRSDLLDYSPATRTNLHRGGMTVGALCEAAIELSDNTAANVLLARVGGPAGLTHAIRKFGDDVTRIDRNEPALNSALPGDPRDTSTPVAMRHNLGNLVSGYGLSPASSSRLLNWLRGSQTGRDRLRAGVPRQWKTGDKTGTGDNGTANDIAVIQTPRSLIVIAAYLTGATAPAAQRDAALAAVARVVIAEMRGTVAAGVRSNAS